MKRFFKKSNKRGFTLLEVMLATCIMTIVSVMLMKGFLSTMNYAHNNNVYSKMGAKNYDDALGQVTTMVGYGKGDGLQKRIDELKTVKTEGKMNVNIVKGGAGVGTISLTVKEWEYSDNTGINIGDTVKGPFAEASSVSHRHSFFYQPTIVKCGAEGGDTHKIRYCIVPADSKKNGWYCRTPDCDNCKKNVKLG